MDALLLLLSALFVIVSVVSVCYSIATWDYKQHRNNKQDGGMV
jgi:hypothetical protein